MYLQFYICKSHIFEVTDNQSLNDKPDTVELSHYAVHNTVPLYTTNLEY